MYVYFSAICLHCGKPAIWCHLWVLCLCTWSVCILVFKAAVTSNCFTSSARGVGNCQHDSSDNLYLLSKSISVRTDLCHAVSGNVPICFLLASDQLYQHAPLIVVVVLLEVLATVSMTGSYICICWARPFSELICAMLFLAMSTSVLCQPLISFTNMHLSCVSVCVSVVTFISQLSSLFINWWFCK